MSAPRRIVYILETERAPRRYYTGLTSDIVWRLAAHNAGRCASTAALRPWRVVVTMEFAELNASSRSRST